jgi:hypothetical protein
VDRFDANDTEEVEDGLTGVIAPLELDLGDGPNLHSAVVCVVELG